MRAFMARVNADEARFEADMPAPVFALFERLDRAARHERMVKDPVERAALHFLMPLGQIARGQLHFAAAIKPAPPFSNNRLFPLLHPEKDSYAN